MKKLMLFFTVAAIVALVYLGCKKERPANVISDNNAERIAKAQNEFTVEEFEIELTTQLNSTGRKINPTDLSYNGIKEIKSEITDLQVEMVTDSTAKITVSELNRVYNKVKNDVHNAAMNEFAQGKDRVLGFVLDEEIILPKAAAGTIQNIVVKLSGTIGNGVTAMPSCTFTTTYNWYKSQPTRADIKADLEDKLNARTPQCVPNYLSFCPAPGKTEKGLPNGTIRIVKSVCFNATPFFCMVGFQELCGPKDPYWELTPSDLQNIVDWLRQSALDNAPVCPCGMLPQPNAMPSLFNIGTTSSGIGTNCVKHFITVAYYWDCCGPCHARSIRLP